MHPDEITAAARRAGACSEFTGKRVVITRPDGQYLCTRGHWSPDRAQAQVFDYTEDRVYEQVTEVLERYGQLWKVNHAQ